MFLWNPAQPGKWVQLQNAITADPPWLVKHVPGQPNKTRFRVLLEQYVSVCPDDITLSEPEGKEWTAGGLGQQISLISSRSLNLYRLFKALERVASK